MFPGSRSCINPVSRVVRLLTHIDDARTYIVPYLHRRFIPSTGGVRGDGVGEGAAPRWLWHDGVPVVEEDIEEEGRGERRHGEAEQDGGRGHPRESSECRRRIAAARERVGEDNGEKGFDLLRS